MGKRTYAYELSRVVYSGFLLNLFYDDAFRVGRVYAVHVHGDSYLLYR